VPALYPKQWGLPSLLLVLATTGCDSTPPPEQKTDRHSNVYLEALQEAEAAKDSVEARHAEQQRIDALLGREGETDR
jgi:hypothetical protein